MQDKTALERGLFDEETVPEELTQVRMGKIVKERYPELSEDRSGGRPPARDRRAEPDAAGEGDRRADARRTARRSGNTALIDGVRKFVMNVRELDIDLIDRINPFEAAYAILAKSMSESMLKQVAAVIASKRINLTLEEARELAKRALKFKSERGRLPDINSSDAWEKRMAEGVAFLQRYAAAIGQWMT